MYEHIKPFMTKIAQEHYNGCKIEFLDYGEIVKNKFFELMGQEGYKVLQNNYILWDVKTKQEKKKTYYTGMSDEVIHIEKKCKNNSFEVYTYLDDEMCTEIEVEDGYYV